MSLLAGLVEATIERSEQKRCGAATWQLVRAQHDGNLATHYLKFSMFRYPSILFLFLLLTTCTRLEVTPSDARTEENFFAEQGAYRAFLARIYAGLAVTGQQGPSGDGDLTNNDEGFSSYLRQYWQLQELTTEEAVIGWNDDGLQDLHAQRWTSDNQFVRTMYGRIFFQISLANEFLRQSTEEKLAARSIPASVRTEIPTYRAEARFLRALSYAHGIDLFGRLPLYTENTQPNGASLTQSGRATIFNYLEEELHDLVDFLPAPGQGEYGRVDRAAVWALQARLFLNAEVYTGRIRYAECLRACERIISSGQYRLEDDYSHLFGADNHLSPEVIFAIPFDGQNTQTWGGMTYLVHAALGGSMDAEDYGVSGSWAGLRTTDSLVSKFAGQPFADRRALFYRDGQSREIRNLSNFQEGYALPKFTNLDRAGRAGSNQTFPDTDFPLFRLAEVYLTYAEAALRANEPGTRDPALYYLNELRKRAGATSAEPLVLSDLTLDFILDERARELYWEGHRRSDLIRYGIFSNRGIWPWKGGVMEGVTTESFRDVFPVPAAELLANPALSQNAGY